MGPAGRILSITMLVGFVLLQPVIWVVRLTNWFLKLVMGYSLVSGSVKQKKESLSSFNRAAHRMKVVYSVAPVSILSPQFNHYILSHLSYEDPVQAIAKDPKVSLMMFSKKYAVFAVTEQGFDVYDSQHGPFVFNVQAEHCVEIITLPIRFVPKLGQIIKDSNDFCQDVVIMWNPGRCGSTAVSRIVDVVPNVVSMSEVCFLYFHHHEKIIRYYILELFMAIFKFRENATQFWSK